jgi:hypothetical protein
VVVVSLLKEHDDHVHLEGWASYDVVYVESHLGKLMIEACDQCEFIQVYCLHAVCLWSDDDTVLTCQLCGQDGT